MSYEIEEYVTADGNKPFADWLLNLRDSRAQAKILARIARAKLGNFGDWKPLKDTGGVREMREHYGPGYRVFFTVREAKVILLLAGSTKKDQKKTIAKAREYLTDFERRLT